MHLRQLAPLGDQLLGQLAVEPQRQDPTLPRRKVCQERPQNEVIVHPGEGGVDGTDERERPEVVGFVTRRVERHQPVGLRREGGGLDLLDAHLKVVGKFGGTRMVAPRLCQLRRDGAHPAVQLLGPARYPHRPRGVAEVPTQGTENARDRVAGEGNASLDVEPVDRSDQGQRRNLRQVVVRLAASGVPVGQPSAGRSR
nr:hypothetical protein [Micromonospora echinofusca]